MREVCGACKSNCHRGSRSLTTFDPDIAARHVIHAEAANVGTWAGSASSRHEDVGAIVPLLFGHSYLPRRAVKCKHLVWIVEFCDDVDHSREGDNNGNGDSYDY